MKVLLAYTSKTGTTKECVERLQKELHGVDSELLELDKQTPNLDAYDILVIGAPVRFGKFPKAVKAFLKDKEAEICQKPHALFLCCGLAHEHEYYLEKLFSSELRATAFAITDFGGTLNYKGQNFFEKILIHTIRSSIRESEFEDGEYTPEMPGILPENIGKLATYIRAELCKLANNKK